MMMSPANLGVHIRILQNMLHIFGTRGGNPISIVEEAHGKAKSFSELEGVLTVEFENAVYILKKRKTIDSCKKL